jgi:hypothetical protein
VRAGYTFAAEGTVFGLFKKKMAVDEFAKNLINIVVREDRQDTMFADQAVEAGVSADTFRLEHLALRVCSAILIMQHAIPDKLWDDFQRNARMALKERTETLSRMDQIVHGAGGFQILDEFVWGRLFDYTNVIETSRTGDVSGDVGAHFSKICCGNPSNGTLSRIGDSTYLVRGDSFLRISRQLKFVASIGAE